MFLPNWNGLPPNEVDLDLQNYFYVYENKLAVRFSAVVEICCYIAKNYDLKTDRLLQTVSTEELDKITKVMLACNAENYSAWNVRYACPSMLFVSVSFSGRRCYCWDTLLTLNLR
jgi:hypothetical protein